MRWPARHPCGPDENRSPPLIGRRRLFVTAGSLALAGAVSAAVAPDAGASTGIATPTQEERRGDAFHGDLGIWPIIWSVPVASQAVALTFDDGPDPEFTPAILDILAARSVRATFNMMGWNCQAHPDLVARVVAAGHEIGNHSWSHLDLAMTDAAQAFHELRHGRDVIEHISGKELTFFRPPRGELTGVALRYAAEQQQSILLWTMNGGASKDNTPALIRGEVAAEDQAGLHRELPRRHRPGHVRPNDPVRPRPDPAAAHGDSRPSGRARRRVPHGPASSHDQRAPGRAPPA